MTLYWIYDLPNWLFGTLVVGFFVGFAVIGLLIHRRFVLKIFGRHPHNDMVSYYLATVGVFYGITLGLISVGTYTTFAEIDSAASTEAVTLSALYNDISSYPEPIRSELKQQLSEYTNTVINVVWPEQRKGRVSTKGFDILRQVNNTLIYFEPATEREKIIHAEAFRQFNQLLESNNARLQSVQSG